ncbi:MAG TPA: aspartate aminotransferase family protein [Candidatus Acidoferrales bacterium]|nr:aspartate aminotransferase family protein [Candidatus Acidoferrales bacterium]
MKVKPPGPASRRLTRDLRRFESRNVTYVDADYPIFLARGAGANVEDVDGNVYVDFSAFFGVAATGHSNARVASAVGAQARQLLHGMGDVYPTENKVALARKLCELTPGNGEKRVIFASTGAEAVEAALKTAVMATGKPGVLCFSSAYHGLGYGALSVTDRDLFRAPFIRQLGHFERRAPYAYCYRCPLDLQYPSCASACLDFVRTALDEPGGENIGAVIVEPMQGRGGEVPAPFGWLRKLRDLCDDRGLLLICDEIFCGFGRTGRWFACEHADIVPDLICVGKGLSSGFPIAACVGAAEVMDRWPASAGEAIHTSTFLGHPAGCTAALASIEQMQERRLVARVAKLERFVSQRLGRLRKESKGRIGDARGLGLMWGLECVDSDGAPDKPRALSVMKAALAHGLLLLTSGPNGNVLSLTPPLVITVDQLDFGIEVLASAIARD